MSNVNSRISAYVKNLEERNAKLAEKVRELELELHHARMTTTPEKEQKDFFRGTFILENSTEGL